MDGNVKVDISGESPHEKALLNINRDIVDRYCEFFTPEPERLSALSSLETAAAAVGLVPNIRDKDRDKETEKFNALKGKVLKKINEELKKAATERYAIAKSSFDMGLGDADDAD